MTNWMTIHWPAREDGLTPTIPDRVWLADGREAAGGELHAGDLVFVYQTQDGPPSLIEQADGTDRRVRRKKGRGGIVAIGEVQRALEKNEEWPIERFPDREDMWWCWQAPLRIHSSAGFVPRTEVCRILGYKENYSFKGWGKQHSGLDMITPAQAGAMRAVFRSGAPGPHPMPELDSTLSSRHGTGEESPEHRLLKEYVAASPADALGERGLRHMHTEYVFGHTGDRADIVLEDRFGCICGVEIEVVVGEGQLGGVLQAIKYRAMLECLWRRPCGEGRAILVAYSITENVRTIASEYGVECFEIDRDTVEADHRQRTAQRAHPRSVIG